MSRIDNSRLETQLHSPNFDAKNRVLGVDLRFYEKTGLSTRFAIWVQNLIQKFSQGVIKSNFNSVRVARQVRRNFSKIGSKLDQYTEENVKAMHKNLVTVQQLLVGRAEENKSAIEQEFAPVFKLIEDKLNAITDIEIKSAQEKNQKENAEKIDALKEKVLFPDEVFSEEMNKRLNDCSTQVTAIEDEALKKLEEDLLADVSYFRFDSLVLQINKIKNASDGFVKNVLAEAGNTARFSELKRDTLIPKEKMSQLMDYCEIVTGLEELNPQASLEEIKSSPRGSTTPADHVSEQGVLRSDIKEENGAIFKALKEQFPLFICEKVIRELPWAQQVGRESVNELILEECCIKEQCFYNIRVKYPGDQSEAILMRALHELDKAKQEGDETFNPSAFEEMCDKIAVLEEMRGAEEPLSKSLAVNATIKYSSGVLTDFKTPS